MLRDYQQGAFDLAKDWLTKSFEPCVIDAATGAGKSHIIAAIAEWISKKSDKKVLCLAPSKELLEQNYKKFVATGNPASFYSASISKSLRHNVIFASPLTLLNAISKFKGKISAVIIDECDGITPTIKEIIAYLRSDNPTLRVVGLTATPYRLGSGYIYQYDQHGQPVPENQARDPYFNRLLCRITAKELIDRGYLTPPMACENSIPSYDTSGLTVERTGKFNSKSVERAFEGQGRKTSKIVADIVEISRERQGVIIFAATIQHAEEIMASLPDENSTIIHGGVNKKDREQRIANFLSRKFKYIVNVNVLTVGFDAPHIDVVAILRATESVRLLQQIIGRGLRLDKGKNDCLVLDYAENIERHCPGGDIFNPDIKATPEKTGTFEINAFCPDCNTENMFGGRPNPEEFQHNKEGYFCDLMGELIVNDDNIPIPAHFGRRCYGQEIIRGESVRCDYRWSSKVCLDCDHGNDIAARFCEKCKCELVDPNEKLRLDYQKIKKNPYSLSTDSVLSWDCQKHLSAAGNETLRINFTTEYRTFSVWYLTKKAALWANLCNAVFGKVAPDVGTFLHYVNKYGKMPVTVTVRRDEKNKFYIVYDHNRPVDEIQQVA